MTEAHPTEGRDAGTARATPPSPSKVRRLREVWVVPLVLAVLFGTIIVALLIETRTYKDGSPGEPGPAAFPIFISVLVLFALSVLVWQLFKNQGERTEKGRIGHPVATLRIGVAAAILLGAAILLEKLGFFVTFSSVFFVMSLMGGAKRWWVALVYGLGLTWLLMFSFGRLLSVPLPKTAIDVFLGG